MTTKTKVEIGTVAEWTEHTTWRRDETRTWTGDVVKAGKTYADVKWRESGRIERIRFRDLSNVIFKSAA